MFCFLELVRMFAAGWRWTRF